MSLSGGGSVSRLNTCDGFAAPEPAAAAISGVRTIAHEFLEAEAEVAEVRPEMFERLDRLIAAARSRLEPYRAAADSIAFATRQLRAIDCLLIAHGVVYPSRGGVHLLADALAATRYDDAEELEALRNHRHNRRRGRWLLERGAGPFYVADCDTASYLYLAIAEVLGYPLAMVDLPNHNFVRWTLPDGRTLNFETMTGQVADDAWYVHDWHLPARFVASGAALRSMRRDEAIAYHHATVGLAWSHRRGVTQMKRSYERAIAGDPTRSFAFNNLAWFYAAAPLRDARDGARAVQLAMRAVDLFPSGDTLHTLACAYAEAGDFERATATLERAIAVNYTPFGSPLAAERERFARRATCDDPDFGRDPEPFRPRGAG